MIPYPKSMMPDAGPERKKKKKLLDPYGSGHSLNVFVTCQSGLSSQQYPGPLPRCEGVWSLVPVESWWCCLKYKRDSSNGKKENCVK